MQLCSGGIISMGESRAQRVEFAEQLRFIEPHMIPINFLNQLPGTGFAHLRPVPAEDALVTLAGLRMFLPDRHLMVAGAEEVIFGDRLAEVFAAGVDAVMVGNYLTALGTAPQFWYEAASRYGLEIVREDVLPQSSCGSC